MAQKTGATRLAEIWSYINSSPTQKTNIQDDMRRKNISEQAIADQLSLGFWLRGGSSEKTRRRAVRASTFLSVVNLKTPVNKIPEVLRNNQALSQQKLDENIAAILALYNDKPKPPARQTPVALTTATRPVHMASMLGGNSQRRALAERALNQASDMLTKAWAHLIRAKTAGTSARAYYESWFGAYTQTRYDIAKGVLGTIHKVLCSGDVCLHLRTTDTIGKHDDTPGAGQNSVIPAQINTANGAYPLSTLFAWAIPKGADGRPHVFLCDIFYATNGKGPHDAMKTGESWADNIGGVMIHELSHALCATKDVVHPTWNQACYGRVLCSDLALNHPDDAVKNADNFEIFCEDVLGRTV